MSTIFDPAEIIVADHNGQKPSFLLSLIFKKNWCEGKPKSKRDVGDF